MTLHDIKNKSGKGYYKISKETGLSRFVIWRFINGRGNITLPTAAKLAKSLGVSINELYQAQVQKKD